VPAPFLVRDSRTAPKRSVLGATRDLPANLRQRFWSPHHRDKAADGYVPARTCLEPVFKVGTCCGYSLMTLKLLLILYSIIYSRNKIVKSRRTTVFSIPRTLMQTHFWCEQPSYIVSHASSAKEPGTPNSRRPDTTLTPTGMQYGATRGKAEKRNSLTDIGDSQTPATPNSSLVMRSGRRFESARRLSPIPIIYAEYSRMSDQ
jgi:hypothetical protein